MKPYGVIAAALASVCFAATAFGAVSLTIDGRPINLDVPPAIIEGRTLVPVRAIFEDLGAKVNWDSDTKIVSAYSGYTTIKLKINDTDAFVNGKPVTLDVPAQIIDGRTLVPARFVAESLNCRVDWDNDTKTVSILTASLPSDIYVGPEDDMIVVANHAVSNIYLNYGNLKARYGDSMSTELALHGEHYVHVPNLDITYVVATDFLKDYELEDDSPVIRIEGKLSDMVDGMQGAMDIVGFTEKLNNYERCIAYWDEKEGQPTSYYISDHYYEVEFSSAPEAEMADYTFEQSLHIVKDADGKISPDSYAWLVRNIF
ncbi:MAG: copper amine oxidase N-terminal domain-containing protein [Firmicutes bacterium]|nr:copper amine oxidase N-terminal domain-containing protein [Bacillota bacterium]